MKSERFLHMESGLDVVVSADATGGFYAIVPALPGCGSQGETLAETLENVDDAITVVIQVMKEDDPDSLLSLFASTTPSWLDGSDSDSTVGDTTIIELAA